MVVHGFPAGVGAAPPRGRYQAPRQTTDDEASRRWMRRATVWPNHSTTPSRSPFASTRSTTVRVAAVNRRPVRALDLGEGPSGAWSGQVGEANKAANANAAQPDKQMARFTTQGRRLPTNPWRTGANRAKTRKHKDGCGEAFPGWVIEHGLHHGTRRTNWTLARCATSRRRGGGNRKVNKGNEKDDLHFMFRGVCGRRGAGGGRGAHAADLSTLSRGVPGFGADHGARRCSRRSFLCRVPRCRAGILLEYLKGLQAAAVEE